MLKYLNSKDREQINIFFDFYSIYELYLKVGGFRDEGYKNYNVFVNERIFRKIKDKYEDVVESYYDSIYKALVYSVQKELRHYPSECQNEEESAKILNKMGFTPDIISFAKEKVEDYLEAALAIYNKIEWRRCFGGPKWGSGVKKLMDARNIKTIHQKVGWCDEVLDLYHNNGHLLDKTSFHVLSDGYIKSGTSSGGKYDGEYLFLNKSKINTNALFYRAKAKSILKFLPYNSDSVKKLVIPRANLLRNPLDKN